jgi:hypothetical protein
MGITYSLFIYYGSILQSEKPFLVTSDKPYRLFEMVRSVLVRASHHLQAFHLGKTYDAGSSGEPALNLLTCG